MFDPKYPDAMTLHIRGPADDETTPRLTYGIFDNFVSERHLFPPRHALLLVAECDFRQHARFTGKKVDDTYIAMPPIAAAFQRGALITLDDREFAIVDYNHTSGIVVITDTDDEGLSLLNLAEVRDLQHQMLARFLRDTDASTNICSRCGGTMLYAASQYELPVAICEDCYYALRLPRQSEYVTLKSA